jgi:hypothetical protein
MARLSGHESYRAVCLESCAERPAASPVDARWQIYRQYRHSGFFNARNQRCNVVRQLARQTRAEKRIDNDITGPRLELAKRSHKAAPQLIRPTCIPFQIIGVSKSIDSYVRAALSELTGGNITVSPIVSRSAKNGETQGGRKKGQGGRRNGITGALHEIEGRDSRFS